MNDPGNKSPRRPSVEQIEQEIKRHENNKELKKALSGAIKNLIVIAAATVLIANLLLSVLMVNRSSMSPTLRDGDIVITLRWVSAKPGDIVAFRYNNKILLKRVIAKAGDWVHIDDEGIVYINNEVLEEPYVTDRSLHECDIDLPYQVPDGTFFVMGDHRTTSADSRLREIGPINSEYVVGKVFLRIWPFTRLGYFG